MLGVGAVTFGLSLVLLFLPPTAAVGAIGTTVGGAILVIGLLVVVISSLANAADEPRSPVLKPPAPEPNLGTPPPL